MRALLDMNVLVALLDLRHYFHTSAQAWLSANLADGWATCPLTESGCLRILINSRYSNVRAPADVLAQLETTKQRGHHEFWPNELSITDATMFDWADCGVISR